ncbi:hypothetical protein B0T22DRAFT_499870 [Podospora appendiculata]|uniref:Tyrosinase copper-binding domain-containing protein n=1 Tax=Podospora appendiculata TaxID=314037 RepID=A0AAE0XDE4_9PEZI|nr:hypothetical protein B0T22DRAFT_499870 [Podospora appendiculata]
MPLTGQIPCRRGAKRWHSVSAILGLALVAAASAAPPSSSLPRDVSEDLVLSPELADLIESAQAQAIQEVTDNEEKLRKRVEAASCTIGNLVFHREYGSLSKQERLAYVNAVKCLQSLPPRTPASVAPGSKSRFDDFTVTHIQQTLSIHYSGIFQPWHRWFVYQYEKALCDECGYTGYQPYWDWPKYAAAPQDSPIFNGEYIPHAGPVIEPPASIGGGQIQLPAGVGGVLVATGPFVNMTVNLGPCDLGGAMNTRCANYYTTVFNLLLTPNVDKFRLVSEGVPYMVEIGPHGGIHYTLGGDPGGDLFTSPGDPAFWVHHGQIDRMWRYTNLGSGNYAHITWANEPASNFTKLSDVIDMGYAGESTTIANVMSTTSGDFCYFYL